MNIQKYQEQHRELLAMAGALSSLLVTAELAKDGAPARHILGEMAGKLTVHLAMEDKVLYPTLLNSGRKEAADLAQRYMDEMGGIKQAFSAYLATWPSGGAIQKDAAGFITQTKGIVAAIGKRIKAEEGHLYPAAEKA